MAPSLRTGYWDDPAARRAFQRFMVEIFGLDFTAWESAGYWDPAYTPFSFFEGDRVVSSVCIYLLDAVLDGKKTRLAQIAGVGTLPDHRRKGLNRKLTAEGLEWARGRHEGVFLFSTDEAIPFYESCGFEKRGEYVEYMAAPKAAAREGLVKLDPRDEGHRNRLWERAVDREPVSNRFGVLNPRLVMFHALYGLHDHVYEVPDLDCSVFLRREEGVLKIFDIVAGTMPSFDELYPYLARPEDRTVEFHFPTDLLGIKGIDMRPLFGNNLFVTEGFPLHAPVFPFTSRA